MDFTQQAWIAAHPAVTSTWLPNCFQGGIFAVSIYDHIRQHFVAPLNSLQGVPLEICLININADSGRRIFESLIIGVQLDEGKTVSAMTKTEVEADYIIELTSKLITPDE